MRIFWLPLLLVLCLNIAIDFFIWHEMKKRGWHVLSRLHVVLAAASHVAIVGTLLVPFNNPATTNHAMVNVMRLIWVYAMLAAPKLVWAILYAPSLALRRPQWLRRAWKGLAAAVSLIVLGLMWQGMRTTPYSHTITEVAIASQRLPAGFDGYRIVHFSDLHLGTYDGDTAFVASCIDAINQLHPDLIVFTGDLVSRTTSEARPFQSALSRLQASDGVLSIMGNHDYDDYTTMTAAERQHDHDALCQLQADCGWTVLNGSHTTLHHAGDSIVVVGTENYSTGHTPNYSHLENDLAGIDASNYIVLLQHNPNMWHDEVLNHHPEVDLMLSGHTHALQMMITMGGKHYSPAQFVYPHWGGHYQQGSQHLYVNTGLGMVGVPARIGTKPEITLITLKNKTP